MRVVTTCVLGRATQNCVVKKRIQTGTETPFASILPARSSPSTLFETNLLLKSKEVPDDLQNVCALTFLVRQRFYFRGTVLIAFVLYALYGGGTHAQTIKMDF